MIRVSIFQRCGNALGCRIGKASGATYFRKLPLAVGKWISPIWTDGVVLPIHWPAQFVSLLERFYDDSPPCCFLEVSVTSFFARIHFSCDFVCRCGLNITFWYVKLCASDSLVVCFMGLMCNVCTSMAILLLFSRE